MPTKKSTADKKPSRRFYAARTAEGAFGKVSEVTPRTGALGEASMRHAEPENPSEARVPEPTDTSKQAILALAGKYRDTSWWEEYEAAIEEVRGEQRVGVTEE